MKTKLTTATALLLNLMCCLASNAATFSAKVVSVIDGDSISILHDGTKERVILYGVDCPEMGQPFGPEARSYTDKAIFGKTVSIEDHGKDKNGRVIAVIFLSDGTNLNQDLVRQGLAWWSDKYAPKDQQLKELHQAAKMTGKGLWSAPQPVPPWTFRNGERKVQAEIKTK